MTSYIDLQRRFHDLTESELDDPEILASSNDRSYGAQIGWPALLKEARVVLLAEAGAGKTMEMREQVRTLVANGKFAFFIALESLDRHPLVDIFSTDEERQFRAWKADDHSPAWFFLDAVDELKLTRATLDMALLRFSRAIDGELDRARVVISCRPYDWRPSLDLATVRTRLPLPIVSTAPTAPRDEFFLAALRRETSKADPIDPQDELAESQAIRTVILLPMSESQIRRFAERAGIQDAPRFLAEVDRQNAWNFARRPLDLSELVTHWRSFGRLGTRAEQHESNVVAKLKDSPDRPDAGVLPDAKARVGAERLALALTLTRMRTIRAPEQTLDLERTAGVLDAADVLSDWTEQERQALLRRALFDPATYGRVRFHHRSVQEFLAAKRLKAHRDNGMSIKALFRLLFAERYNFQVVLPAMRPIAAWLSLWDNHVCRELTCREPETLLTFGDPETLRLAARAELIRAFAAAYGEGGWRGLHIPRDEVRRLADPGLAPTIRDLWGEGPTNPDVRELLIELIRHGRIDACADLARAAAFAVHSDADQREAAIRALLASGCDATVREIADAILADTASWPPALRRGLATDLFPRIISVDELLILIERTPEPKQIVHGFGWALREIVDNDEITPEQAALLRHELAHLIWTSRRPNPAVYRLQSRYDHLTPALSTLCERALGVATGSADSALIRSCVIASRFGRSEHNQRESVDRLRTHFADDLILRRDTFWDELAFVSEVAVTNDDWKRFGHVTHESLVRLAEKDRPWLEAALADRTHPERRPIALHALIFLWRQRGRLDAELGTIRSLVRDDAPLEAILTEHTSPRERDAQMERTDRHQRRRECLDAIREERRLQSWKAWHQDLLTDPTSAFADEQRDATIENLHKWLTAVARSRVRRSVWDREAITHAFGPTVAQLATEALRGFWRANPPVLWSARSSDERNRLPYSWLYGLCGLSAETSSSGWTSRLTPGEIRTAIEYATVELNGFAPFIHDLAISHPAEVAAVLGAELCAELNIGGDYNHLPVLQALTHAETGLKQLLAPRLQAALCTWPRAVTSGSESNWTRHLEQVLRILNETSAEQDRRTIAEECASRYEADADGSLALMWLRGLFCFDSERGARAIATSLRLTADPKTTARAIETFGTLFNHHEAVVLEIADPAQRARALGQLLRLAYAFVRPEDDPPHEGTYTPDLRDRAEAARSFLLSALLETPGHEANRQLLELASEPDFAHFPDRLRLLARQRAAADSEHAISLEAMADLERRHEAPPHDRDGLFSVMIDRLDDLAHEIAHHDFTDRRTLRSISEEVEMQRTLALRIEGKSNGAFVITREDEVADSKRTDIRLSTVRGHQKAVIEVKLAQRWSLRELERALRAQLHGQYLRHETCRAGCLLLVYDGERNHWEHPETQRPLTFEMMLAYLADVARSIEAENLHSVRLSVFGLDLTDPSLEAAHRDTR